VHAPEAVNPQARATELPRSGPRSARFVLFPHEKRAAAEAFRADCLGDQNIPPKRAMF
jgi:hypothetical protein